MVRTWVFTLERVQSLNNAFNKETTRKLPLPGTTTKGHVINATSNNEERKGNQSGEHIILTYKTLSNKGR
jgi:hypothetical protein